MSEIDDRVQQIADSVRGNLAQVEEVVNELNGLLSNVRTLVAKVSEVVKGVGSAIPIVSNIISFLSNLGLGSDDKLNAVVRLQAVIDEAVGELHNDFLEFFSSADPDIGDVVSSR